MGVKDLKLGVDGDLAIEGGDLAFVDGNEGIKQAVQIRLRFFLGEYFLDLDVGIPYFEVILVKNPNMSEVREWFRSTIADTPGIADVSKIEFQYDDRRLTVNWSAIADSSLIAATQVVP